MSRKKATMAIAYDFDGTLAPGNMQEHQFLPDIGMTPAAFWKEVHETAKQHQADEVLVYMNLMLRKASAHNVPVRRDDFKSRGKSIKLFDGVADWFTRISAYAKSKGVDLKHYLVPDRKAQIPIQINELKLKLRGKDSTFCESVREREFGARR